MLRRGFSGLLVLLLVLSACSITDDVQVSNDVVSDASTQDTSSATVDEPAEAATVEVVPTVTDLVDDADGDDEPAADSPDDTDGPDDPDGEWNDGTMERAGYDPTLTADTPCLENEGDPLAGIVFTVAHQVVDGELGATCFGSEDETLIEAWYILSDITPPDQLRDLAVFAGFNSLDPNADGLTFAFVVAVDDDASQFQMAVNLQAARDDWDETALTMAHEFSHVFTALPTELDRYAPVGDCATYDNLEGCYTDSSIMSAWYQRFWPDFGYLPGNGAQAEEADGVERCDLNPGFFGSYGASNPEEDFAEAFAAYVMRVEAASSAQQEKLDWIDELAGLREFRDRAEATGYGPLPNNFGQCG